MAFLPEVALFALLLLGLVAFGLALGSPRAPILEATLLPPALLLGVFAFVVWVVGSLVAFVPQSLALGLVLLIIGVLAWRWRNLTVNARRLTTGLRGLGRLEGALVFYLLAVWGLAFVLCLAPPSGSDYDSLVYHLGVPAQYLRDGKISELSYDHHSYFPFTLEMLYSVGLALRGELGGAVLAKLCHWLMLPLGGLALVGLGARAGSRAGGWLAAALYTSLPMTLTEATTAYIDLGFTAWVLLALLCFAGAPTTERGQNWAWSGAFCGLCLGTKYFGALVLGFLGIWLLVEGLRTKTLRFGHLAAFAIPALVLGAPWYARNFVWTHNPVFPFAYGLFGGEGWTAERAAAYDLDQSHFGFGKSLSDLLWLPWRLAMAPLGRQVPYWPFLPGAIGPPQSGLFDVPALFAQTFPGPVLLAIGVPALLAHGKSRPVAVAAWFFAFLWVFWAITSQQVRYLFPALALLCLVAGWSAATRSENLPLSRLIGGFLVGVWLLFAPALMLFNAQGLGVISGAEAPEAYLRRTCPGYVAMEWIGVNTPPTARVAVYGEPRDFYLPRHFFWADDGHNMLVENALKAGASDLGAALRQLGATYVLVNAAPERNGGVYGPPPEFAALVQSGAVRLMLDPQSGRGYAVYQLTGSALR